MFWQSLKMASESIRVNKMRSFLTMLGIVIGVIALVVLVSVVDGATDEIVDTVASLGSNLLSVQINDDKGRPLRMQDLEELRRYGELSEIAPGGTEIQMVRCGQEEERAAVVGTTAAYDIITNQEVAYGRGMNGSDVDNHLNVAVVNRALVTDVMRIENPEEAIGKEIHLRGFPFLVIGVYAEEEAAAGLYSMSSYSVEIPYTALIRISRNTYAIRSFVASAGNDAELDALERNITDWLLRRFGDDTKAFTIINMSSILGAMDKVTDAMSQLLATIAAISLLVGGIGIMNIMLVSVTERTREIGIRKAIGAGQGSILLQFLVEALFLSLLGCLLGVLISWIIVTGINTFSTHHFRVSRETVLSATGFSTVIGVLFGIYPARKAAKKKPIDALHYGG